MTRTILDVHILQVVPPSNLNRDDTGTPKSAYYGGVRRARVSSQAWKRATRATFNELLPPGELGVRSKKLAGALAERIADKSEFAESVALPLAVETLKTATGSTKIEPPKRKKGDEEASKMPVSLYLMFLSSRQLDALADLAIEHSGPEGDVQLLMEWLKKNKAVAKNAVDARHSVDIALFGRMVADSSDLNVEAATQVAHAISVHKSDIESDYYTAVDDLIKDDESGAGMIGTVDFNSATLYRYAAVDVNELHRNLGLGLQEGETPSTPAEKAVTAFLEAFITSLPTGKINSFGNHTLPSAVIVKLRDRRPVSFVSAFEEPVPQGAKGGYLRESCQQLAEYVPNFEKQYGIETPTDHSWVFRVGNETEALAPLGRAVSLKTLLEEVRAAVAQRLGSGV
ncbi:type I-E CRISPR-associated protein Cas7/Cse4/CasC [Streptomyces acidiscabies]|uniref:type I-E CRISPR-associated protein Cas7/Cse4/CasC n=1 Tax=Streptomyces acidiscabies TaxID=42234 RepID=UPI0038F7FCFA